MTQIINQTTAKTAKNLKKAFDLITISREIDIETYKDDVWKLCNKQKFKSLIINDNQFRKILTNNYALDIFKNDLLRLQNHSSNNKDHEEISISIIKEIKHKRWIRHLS